MAASRAGWALRGRVQQLETASASPARLTLSVHASDDGGEQSQPRHSLFSLCPNVISGGVSAIHEHYNRERLDAKTESSKSARRDHDSSSSAPTRLPSVGPTSPQNDQPRCDVPAWPTASAGSISSSSPAGTLTPSSSIDGGGRFCHRFDAEKAATKSTMNTAMATMARPATSNQSAHGSRHASCGDTHEC